MSEFTMILEAVGREEPDAAEELLKLVYDELRKLAAFRMSRQPPGQTLQPTALVHEAWLKLLGSASPTFKDRAHFFSAAAEAMRHILIDRARRKKTRRHGGDWERLPFPEFEIAGPVPDDQLLALNDALERFERQFPTQAQVVKLRYFAGMTNDEIAELIDVSTSTVKNYWNFARAWLFRDMENQL